MNACDRIARRGRVPRVAAFACALLLLAACGAEPPPAAPRAGPDGWLEFHGSWDGAGSRSTIALGDGRRASIVDLSGSMLLAGPSRPGVGFGARVVGLGDTATGFSGRAVWTDQKGDQVYSELTGQGTATGNRITGTFIGGTGRYRGATGSYAFTWQYVLQSDDGTIQGRAVGLTGRVRIGDTPPAAAGQGAKP